MIIILPKWYTELTEKINETIKNTAVKNNINLNLVGDSLAIDNAIQNICNTMMYIGECEHPLQTKVVPPKMGRPTVITPSIEKFISKNPKIPSRKLAVMIKDKFGVKISNNTICNQRKVKHEKI